MLDGIRSPILTLSALTVELLLYKLLRYRGAVELFAFLNDLIICSAAFRFLSC